MLGGAILLLRCAKACVHAGNSNVDDSDVTTILEFLLFMSHIYLSFVWIIRPRADVNLLRPREDVNLLHPREDVNLLRLG